MKANSWLLLEHSGAWPRRVEQLGLPVVDEALRHGVRPQLIRRTGRRAPTPPMRVFVGWSGPSPWLETRMVRDPAELAQLDLAAVAAGERPRFGRLTNEPLFLVCTHAKRNACCARTGGPLARDLAARHGGLVWETSHVGGDLYAANMVCLPHGLYYGALDAETAGRAAEAYLRGEVVLDRLRGRAGLPQVAQAAEHFVRAHTGLLGVDQVGVISVTGTGPFMTRVTAGRDVWSCTVEQAESAGCRGHDCDETVVTYQMRDLALHSEAALV